MVDVFFDVVDLFESNMEQLAGDVILVLYRSTFIDAIAI